MEDKPRPEIDRSRKRHQEQEAPVPPSVKDIAGQKQQPVLTPKGENPIEWIDDGQEDQEGDRVEQHGPSLSFMKMHFRHANAPIPAHGCPEPMVAKQSPAAFSHVILAFRQEGACPCPKLVWSNGAVRAAGSRRGRSCRTNALYMVANGEGG